MAKTAFILCRYMIFRLAGGNDTIMAGAAVINDAIMIKGNAGKSVEVDRTMTNRTVLGGG